MVHAFWTAFHQIFGQTSLLTDCDQIIGSHDRPWFPVNLPSQVLFLALSHEIQSGFLRKCPNRLMPSPGGVVIAAWSAGMLACQKSAMRIVIKSNHVVSGLLVPILNRSSCGFTRP